MRDMVTETFGQTAARRLILDARAGSAGATEYPGSAPVDGYLVGDPAAHVTLNLDSDTIESVTASWIDTVLTSPNADYVSVGIWLNPENKYDLDFCTWHKDGEVALTIAEERGELAIWDVANGNELIVSETL